MTTGSEDTTELLSKITIEFSAFKEGDALSVDAIIPSLDKHYRLTMTTFQELYEGFSAIGATEVFVTTEIAAKASLLLRNILREIMELSPPRI